MTSVLKGNNYELFGCPQTENLWSINTWFCGKDDQLCQNCWIRLTGERLAIYLKYSALSDTLMHTLAYFALPKLILPTSTFAQSAPINLFARSMAPKMRSRVSKCILGVTLLQTHKMGSKSQKPLIFGPLMNFQPNRKQGITFEPREIDEKF